MATNYLTASSGTITWSTSTNWSGLATPANSDNTTIANSSGDITLGLNQASVTLANLIVPMTFTGTAGLTAKTPKSVTSITRSSNTATVTITSHGYAVGDTVVISGASESDYNGTYTVATVPDANTFTYTVANTPSTPASGTIICRQYDYLRIGATAFRYGDAGNGATAAVGSGRFKIDFSSIQTAAVVVNTKSQGTDSNLEPLRILGSNSSNTLTVLAGLVGVATTVPSETATFATINIAGGTLNCGAGTTWTTIYQTGGTLNMGGGASGSSILNQSAGTTTLNGSGTLADIKAAGTVKLNLRKATSGDTITSTLWLLDGAVLDLRDNPADISVGTFRATGNVTVYRSKANPGHFSWTTLTQDPGSTINFA